MNQHQDRLKGKSIPDNAEEFYSDVLDWFDDYVANPNDETVLKIDLEYFNISSSKRLLFLLYKLNELNDMSNSVKVQWLLLAVAAKASLWGQVDISDRETYSAKGTIAVSFFLNPRQRFCCKLVALRGYTSRL